MGRLHIVTISSDPNGIAIDDASKLTWASTNATSCVASGRGVVWERGYERHGCVRTDVGATWTGVWTEDIEISDNWFGGNSGGNLVENAPQNGGLDERLRKIVVERNLFAGSTTAQGGTQLSVSAQNETVRDNVFYMIGPTSKTYPILGMQAAQRGGGNIITQYIEAYNNTCYAPNAQPAQICIGYDTLGSKASAASNSVARNNLYYVPAGGYSAIDNKGTGNTVSNNSPNPGSDPGFLNSSGTFNVIADFQPTANYAGGTSVPVIYDALGVLWPPTWDLGAVQH